MEPTEYGASMDLLEAMGTARAMRWFEPTPIPREKIDTLLWAATRAPSPGNTQGWQFVVVTDEVTRTEIGKLIAPIAERLAAPQNVAPDAKALRAGSLNMITNFGKIPLMIFVCGRNVYPPDGPRTDMMHSAMYGAAQNILLAARAIGLGGAMTSFHSPFERQLRPLLGIPDDVAMGALLPIGYPARAHGPVRRQPVEEVVHWEKWGEQGADR